MQPHSHPEKPAPPSDELLVQYLLGEELPEPEVERIEEAYFAGGALLDRLEATEAALMDDYVTGRLAAAQRLALERHFSQSERRRREIALRAGIAAVSRQRPPGRAPGPAWLFGIPARWRYGSLAAGVALCVGILLLALQTRNLRNQVRNLQAKIRDTPTVGQPAGGPVVAVLRPGVSRSEGDEVIVPVSSARSDSLVRLRLVLDPESPRFESFQAEIVTSDGSVRLLQHGLKQGSGEGAEAVLEVAFPGALLPPGFYIAKLSGIIPGKLQPLRSYTFVVR